MAELKDLVGLHELTGVDFGKVPAKDEYSEVSDCINFVLDGVTYSAIEDADDGYRSSMRELTVGGITVTNTFPPVRVMARMGDGDEAELLHVFDVVTGLEVLTVGTDDWDDYYPVFTASFMPENMVINRGGSAQ